MEFRFNVNEVFKQPIVEINASLIPPGLSLADKRALWDAVAKVSDVVNTMGEASATAQGLTKPITTSERLRNSEHKLYLLIDQNANNGKGVVTGMLKTGKKGLYVFDRDGHHYQVQPACVLDFYIHETKQRMGLGKKLFEHMLEREEVEPVKMAIDRPSDKFLGFLNKHYSLDNPVKQMNNFVVYDGFFPESCQKGDSTENNNTPLGKSNQSANGLQTSYASPYGRYGAPRPPCSMGQIIHNQSPLAQQTQEPAGTSLNIRVLNKSRSLHNDKQRTSSIGNRQTSQSMPSMMNANQNYYTQYPQHGVIAQMPQMQSEIEQNQNASVHNTYSQPQNQQYYQPQRRNLQPVSNHQQYTQGYNQQLQDQSTGQMSQNFYPQQNPQNQDASVGQNNQYNYQESLSQYTPATPVQPQRKKSVQFVPEGHNMEPNSYNQQIHIQPAFDPQKQISQANPQHSYANIQYQLPPQYSQRNIQTPANTNQVECIQHYHQGGIAQQPNRQNQIQNTNQMGYGQNVNDAVQNYPPASQYLQTNIQTPGHINQAEYLHDNYQGMQQPNPQDYQNYQGQKTQHQNVPNYNQLRSAASANANILDNYQQSMQYKQHPIDVANINQERYVQQTNANAENQNVPNQERYVQQTDANVLQNYQESRMQNQNVPNQERYMRQTNSTPQNYQGQDLQNQTQYRIQNNQQLQQPPLYQSQIAVQNVGYTQQEYPIRQVQTKQQISPQRHEEMNVQIAGVENPRSVQNVQARDQQNAQLYGTNEMKSLANTSSAQYQSVAPINNIQSQHNPINHQQHLPTPNTINYQQTHARMPVQQSYSQMQQQVDPYAIAPPTGGVNNQTNQNYLYYDSNAGKMQGSVSDSVKQTAGNNAGSTPNASGDKEQVKSPTEEVSPVATAPPPKLERPQSLSLQPSEDIEGDEEIKVEILPQTNTKSNVDIVEDIKKLSMQPDEAVPPSKTPDKGEGDGTRKTPSHLTEQGFFDLKFYHNKLW